jgi:hypothetical protein
VVTNGDGTIRLDADQLDALATLIAGTRRLDVAGAGVKTAGPVEP